MALTNLLTPAWLAKPSVFPALSPLEREVVTDYGCFEKLGELRHGICVRGPPVKTIHMLTSKTHGRTPGEIIKLQSCPPGYKVKLNVQQTGQAYRKLLEISNVHRTTFPDGVTPEFKRRVYEQKTEDFVNKLTDVVGSNRSVEELPQFLPLVPTVEEPDWFA